MLEPPVIHGVELELANGGSIKEVASFFVDSFWVRSEVASAVLVVSQLTIMASLG